MSVPISKEYVKDTLTCARATLNKDLNIIIAEETFYGFVGKNSMYPMDTMVYEEDLGDFRRVFAENIKEPMFIRFRRCDGAYRWCIFLLISNDVVINGENFYEIELRDLISVNERFSYMDENLNKYRNFLTLIKERFFEYDMQTNIFKIYTYRDNRAELLEKDDLDEWKKRIIRLEQVDKENLGALEQLCDNIRNGVDSIRIQFNISVLKKGERVETLSFRGQAIYRGGEKYMVVGLIESVNKKAVNKDYYYSAFDNNKDSATGLMNKKAITEFAISRVNLYRNEYYADSEKTLHMVIIDIDYFKNVNDTYGHFFGDEVIMKFASTIKHVVGERGMVGRIGGDEFFVLLEGLKDTEALRLILKTIRKRMFYAFPNRTPNYVFTCSIGVSEFRKDASDYETLFRLADKALYIAKDKGRDRFIIYDREKHGELNEGLTDKKLAVNTGISMKPLDKLKMAAEITEDLVDRGLQGLGEALTELVERLNIHGISVYAGRDLNCIETAGVYVKPILNARYVLEESYLNQFNELGIYVMNNVESLYMEYPRAYALMKESTICSSLQFLIGSKENLKGLISLDVFGNVKRKWGDNDVSLLYLIANRISNVILKAED